MAPQNFKPVISSTFFFWSPGDDGINGANLTELLCQSLESKSDGNPRSVLGVFCSFFWPRNFRGFRLHDFFSVQKVDLKLQKQFGLGDLGNGSGNRPSGPKKEIHLPSIHFQVLSFVSFREGKYEDVVALGRVWLSLQSNPSNLGLLTFPFSISTQKKKEMFFRYHLESSSRNHTWRSENFLRFFFRFHPSLFLVHPSFPPHQLHGNKGLQNADAFQAAHCKEHAQEEQGLNSERSFRFPEPFFLSFHKKLLVERIGDENGDVQIVLSTETGKTKFLCV